MERPITSPRRFMDHVKTRLSSWSGLTSTANGCVGTAAMATHATLARALIGCTHNEPVVPDVQCLCLADCRHSYRRTQLGTRIFKLRWLCRQTGKDHDQQGTARTAGTAFR